MAETLSHESDRASAAFSAEEPAAGASLQSATLIVENMHCGGCMRSVETTLQSLPGVALARTNLTAKHVAVSFDPERTEVSTLVDALVTAGFHAAERTNELTDSDRSNDRDLLLRVGVAGFAAANVMLLSVAVWAGLASDMDATIQTLFHWLSALIALPAIAYAGMPFYRSAAAALGARRLNMDVPISLGLILATGMSVFQTMRGSEQVYFDAALTLAFFLLIGRYLDQRLRARTLGAAQDLMSLRATSATVIGDDGVHQRLPASAISPGMQVLVAMGERIPIDGVVRDGHGAVEESLITGETLPRAVGRGSDVFAATLNVGQPLQIEATKSDEGTLVAEIGRLLDAASQARGRYVRIADRAARIYAPAVHLLSGLTLIGWLIAGAGWVNALTAAIAVLIITCPCALALAVPAVQMAAVSRLFANGIIIKSADGLERLAEIDTVVFDKTGTLTLGEPQLSADVAVPDDVLRAAASLALASRHPYARAIVRAARARGLEPIADAAVREDMGQGLVRPCDGGEERLGSAAWTGVVPSTTADTRAALWYIAPGSKPVGFELVDALRPDAKGIAAKLHAAGLDLEILSGDRVNAVAHMADEAGIAQWRAEVRPAGKIARLEELKRAGHSVLMVGDGLNDAPALAAAHASLSPSTAADLSQTTADAVFQGVHLAPVVTSIAVARRARRMALQNFAIALSYNAVCVPLAMAGLVTPLIAAVAMSASSITVTLNAVRLRTERLEFEA